MLELSARKAGYHVVFRRREELSQEDNLKWASNILGVDYDDNAKDITRVFYTTTASEEDLIYLDDEIFEAREAQAPAEPKKVEIPDTHENTPPQDSANESNCETQEPLPESLYAFDQICGIAGIDPERMDVWGVHNWHSNLLSVLSAGLPQLLSRE